MSNRSWQERLAAELHRLTENNQPPRLAFVGIGHELCGDDAVGIRIADLLRPLVTGDERVLIIAAGPAPENFTSVLRRFHPDLVVMLDSALMEEQPGAIRWLDWQETEGVSASTHTLPLHIFASYLTAELGCSMALIGVQPGQTFADAPLTPPVQAAAQSIAAALSETIKLQACSPSTV